MQDDLATLVGSRICHDLISPIGAIGNGVELLELTGGEGGSELSLISESVQNANARIRFFRIAFGNATSDQSVARRDILSILSATARGGRMTYFWKVDSDLPRSEVRIAFLLLLCFESAMPVGGDVTISCEAGQWTLIAKGDRIKFEADLWNGLNDPQIDVNHTAAFVQFALLPIVLKDAGRKLIIDEANNQLSVRF